ncbi:MAG: thiamine pyrophosphate-binding protein [Candidatus Tectomicrobia bacterium]|uniref:Thiamine pyrophosphate-binding protein n=1 Tax=Tectimicrobiota bacterium TaxID=2528274 RepID=A0A932GSQ5_UNCTE|nr:thiamine pyrophosphate-binding protein [Candidatus Tectomicrobia bacterium]
MPVSSSPSTASVAELATPRRPEYGSDHIVDVFKALDIEYTAFNPGATFRGIHDSIVNYGGNTRPEVIECCHEEISVAVAHGYAKAAGKPMIAIVHNIVGLQHASMAIFNAWCDRVPVLVLGGTGPMDTMKRRPWIDWIHTALVQGNLVRDFVKWDDQPHTLSNVAESFLRGYRIALTEPQGPIYICYDAEIQEGRVTEEISIPDVSRYGLPAPFQAERGALEKAADLLTRAKFPVIIADFVGRNPGAVRHLVELAETLNVPVLDTDKRNRFNFPNTHPLDLSGADNEIIKKADVILGLDVQDLFGALSTTDRVARVARMGIGKETQVIHIHLNDLIVRSWSTDYQRLPAVDLPILADTSVALPELVTLCKERLKGENPKTSGRQQRREECTEIHHRLRQTWAEAASTPVRNGRLTVPFVAKEVYEAIKSEDWTLVNGDFNSWVRRLWTMDKPYQYLGRAGGGGVGYGMGASLGATLANKGNGRLCVDIQSDGDLLYCASSLWTAAHHRIPLLAVMFNNRSYYNSQEHGINMAKARNRPVEKAGIGTEITDPNVDFTTLAKAYGLWGKGPITRPEEVRPAIQEALRHVKEQNEFALVDIVMEPR